MSERAEKVRRHRRLGVNLMVSHESVSSYRQDSTANISEGGIFIQTARPLPEGTTVYMDIHLDEARSADYCIHAVGEVVWQREEVQGAQPSGMGVVFIQIADNDKERFTKFVEDKAVERAPAVDEEKSTVSET